MDIYCAILDGQALSYGDLAPVLKRAYQWEIDENRRLILNPKNYPHTVFHSYSKDYSREEIENDVNRFLLSDVVKNAYPIEIFKRV